MNKKKFFNTALLILIFAIGFIAQAELVNPGFEKLGAAEKEETYKYLQDQGWTFDKPLVYPEGWKPNPGAMKNGEYRLITDSGIAHSGSNCIYLKGHFMQTKSIDVTAGDDVEISLYVKDSDKRNAGVALYLYYKDERGTDRWTGTLQVNVKTGPEWTRQTIKTRIPEESQGKRVNAVIVALVSYAGAYFDDVEMVRTKTTKWLNFHDASIEGNKKLAQGDFSGARADFNVGLELTEEGRERIDTLLKIAESYLKEKNYTQAIETFGKILKDEEPADNVKVDITIQIADTYIKEQNYSKAIEVLSAVLKMEETVPVVRVSTQFKIGDIYVTARNYVEARKIYSAILSMPATNIVDKFDVYRKTGDTYRTEKDYGKAREFYNKALSLPDINIYSKAPLLDVLGGTFLAEERYEEAREVYERILELDSKMFRNQINAYIKIGETYRKEGNYNKERETFFAMEDWAKKGIPTWASAYIPGTRADAFRLTGDSYWEEGDKEKAEHYYLLYLEIWPRIKLSSYDNFLKEVEIKIGKNEPAAHIRKAEALFFERKYEEAKSEYADVLKSEKAIPHQKAVAYMGRGDIYLAQEDFNKTVAEYQKVLGMKDATLSEKVKALTLIGDSYSIEQKYRQARTEYAKVLSMKDSTPLQKIAAQEKIAEMYRAEQNYSQAREEYGKILKMEGLSDLQKEVTEQRILYIYR